MMQALEKLDAVPEPKASGGDMTIAEMEEMLDEKDVLIRKLQ